MSNTPRLRLKRGRWSVLPTHFLKTTLILISWLVRIRLLKKQITSIQRLTPVFTDTQNPQLIWSVRSNFSNRLRMTAIYVLCTSITNEWRQIKRSTLSRIARWWIIRALVVILQTTSLRKPCIAKQITKFNNCTNQIKLSLSS